MEEGTVRLQRIGQTTPQKSSKILKWHDEEEHEGFFQPSVLPGRVEMGAVLTTQHTKVSPRKATSVMKAIDG